MKNNTVRKYEQNTNNGTTNMNKTLTMEQNYIERQIYLSINLAYFFQVWLLSVSNQIGGNKTQFTV